MRKLILMVICLFTLCFSGCFFENTLPESLDVKISKSEVKVGEQVDITGIVTKAYFKGQTDLPILFEGYPATYNIVEGKLYEPWTNESVLCIFPDLLERTNGIIKLNISFDKADEYKILINGCSIKDPKYTKLWHEEAYNYKITVTE